MLSITSILSMGMNSCKVTEGKTTHKHIPFGPASQGDDDDTNETSIPLLMEEILSASAKSQFSKFCNFSTKEVSAIKINAKAIINGWELCCLSQESGREQNRCKRLANGLKMKQEEERRFAKKNKEGLKGRFPNRWTEI